MAMTYTGVMYFPLKVNLPEEMAVELVEAKYGLKGTAVVMKLLCKIYKENGYYLAWSEEQCALFSNKVGRDVTAEEMQGMVDILVAKGFFDRRMYEEQGVLTSGEIQKVWLEATKRRKRELASLPFLLEQFRTKEETATESDNGREETHNASEVPPCVCNPDENADNLAQSKEEQSKGEQRKAGLKEEESAGNKQKQEPPDYARNKQTHNYEGLLLTLNQLRIADPEDVQAILRLSDYGRLGGHVWKVIHGTRWKEISARGKYLIAALAKEKRKDGQT